MLERYSFLWSEARLLIAALALFLGGVPVLTVVLPVPVLYGLVRLLLTLSWIISGAASGYLIYRWFTGGKKVFGGKDNKDVIAFFVSVVSGLNLGLTGLTGQNPGMSLASGGTIFTLVGLVYLVSAWHLWRRWKATGEKMVG